MNQTEYARDTSLRNTYRGSLFSHALRAVMVLYTLTCFDASAESSESLQVSALANKRSYWIREPILITLTYKNMLPLKQTPIIYEPDRVILANNSGKQEEYFLFRTMQEAIEDSPGGAIEGPVEPGKSSQFSVCLLLGVQSDGDGQEVFLFDAPGRYAVTFGDALRAQVGPNMKTLGEKLKIEVEVKAPEKPIDREALRFFSLGAAKVILGETSRIEQGTNDLRAICEKYPLSVYAPVSAIEFVKYLFRTEGESKADLESVRKILDVVITNHRDHPLREEALCMLIRAYQAQQKRQEAVRWFEVLAQEYPKSGCLSEFQPLRARPSGNKPESTDTKREGGTTSRQGPKTSWHRKV